MGDNQPKVSTVIATYNRDEYIEGAVKTVLNQTYDNIELIVVNDGSDDDTAEILSQYDDSEQVTALHNDANQGISYSFNRGAEHADGRYIAFCGDDDRWDEDKIRMQVEVFQRLDDEYCGVYTRADVVNEEGEKTEEIRKNNFVPDIYPRILLYCEISPHSSALLRRDHFEAVGGYDVRFPRGVDWDLWIRMGREYKFEYMSESLMTIYRHGGNISQESDHEQEVRTLIRKKYYDDFEEYPKIRANFDVLLHRQRGVDNLTGGNRLSAIKHFALATRTKPVVHNFIYLGLGLLGPGAFRVAKRLKHGSTTVGRFVNYLRRWEE